MTAEDSTGGVERVTIAEGFGRIGISLLLFVSMGVGDGIALEEDHVSFF